MEGQTDEESEDKGLDEEKDLGEEKESKHDPCPQKDPFLEFRHVGRPRLHDPPHFISKFPKEKEENADGRVRDLWNRKGDSSSIHGSPWGT